MSSIRGSEVKKICLACEAGAGSSLMVKNGLIKKAKKAGLEVEIVHAPATQIPDDAD
ncbi:MAG: PTS lactose transporter subunit IIB, partial [Candidatus Actinomarina sp.]|nr:PTS lactose transporter subunit IIB [Candidatus Actinomarina sp.]